MRKRVITDAELILEHQAIARLTELGAEIVAHKAYSSCSEKVRAALAETMRDEILEITGMASSVRDIKNMLEQIDPNITFFKMTRFNRATSQLEVFKSTIYHDTIDEQVKNAIGYSIDDVLKRQELLNPEN